MDRNWKPPSPAWPPSTPSRSRAVSEAPSSSQRQSSEPPAVDPSAFRPSPAQGSALAIRQDAPSSNAVQTPTSLFLDNNTVAFSALNPEYRHPRGAMIPWGASKQPVFLADLLKANANLTGDVAIDFMNKVYNQLRAQHSNVGEAALELDRFHESKCSTSVDLKNSYGPPLSFHNKCVQPYDSARNAAKNVRKRREVGVRTLVHGTKQDPRGWCTEEFFDYCISPFIDTSSTTAIDRLNQFRAKSIDLTPAEVIRRALRRMIQRISGRAGTSRLKTTLITPNDIEAVRDNPEDDFQLTVNEERCARVTHGLKPDVHEFYWKNGIALPEVALAARFEGRVMRAQGTVEELPPTPKPAPRALLINMPPETSAASSVDFSSPWVPPQGTTSVARVTPPRSTPPLSGPSPRGNSRQSTSQSPSGRSSTSSSVRDSRKSPQESSGPSKPIPQPSSLGSQGRVGWPMAQIEASSSDADATMPDFSEFLNTETRAGDDPFTSSAKKATPTNRPSDSDRSAIVAQLKDIMHELGFVQSLDEYYNIRPYRKAEIKSLINQGHIDKRTINLWLATGQKRQVVGKPAPKVKTSADTKKSSPVPSTPLKRQRASTDSSSSASSNRPTPKSVNVPSTPAKKRHLEIVEAPPHDVVAEWESRVLDFCNKKLTDKRLAPPEHRPYQPRQIPVKNPSQIHKSLWDLAQHDEKDECNGVWNPIPSELKASFLDAVKKDSRGHGNPAQAVGMALRTIGEQSIDRNGRPEQWLYLLRGFQMGMAIVAYSTAQSQYIRRVLKQFHDTFGFKLYADVGFEDGQRRSIDYADMVSFNYDEHHTGWLTDYAIQCSLYSIIERARRNGKKRHDDMPWVVDSQEWAVFESDSTKVPTLPKAGRRDIYIPAHSLGHWHLIILHRLANDKNGIYVLDSSANVQRRTASIKSATALAKAMGSPRVQIISADVFQQQDAYNCGIHVLQNAHQFLTDGTLPTTAVGMSERAFWIGTLYNGISASEQHHLPGVGSANVRGDGHGTTESPVTVDRVPSPLRSRNSPRSKVIESKEKVTANLLPQTPKK